MLQRRFLTLSSVEYVAAVSASPVSATRVSVSAACTQKRDRPLASNGVGRLDAVVAGEAASQAVSNSGELSEQGQYAIVGWAVDPALNGPARGVCLVLDGRLDPRAASSFGGARPDVAAAYNNDRLLRSAYMIAISPDSLSPGRHEIQVAAISAEGSLATIGGRVSSSKRRDVGKEPGYF